MLNLLSAEISRLYKNKLFWLSSILVTGVGVYEIIMEYMDGKSMGTVTSLDASFFSFIFIVCGCTAVFTSMFIGTEYSDGTIRNKLVVGHRREQLYICAYVTSLCASTAMMALWFAVYFTLGLLLLGGPILGVPQMLAFIGLGILIIMAFDALYVFISLLVSNKASAAVACMLLFFGLFVVAVVINGMLEAPEFVQDYSITANGVELMDPLPNPRYLSGMKREVYQFIYDFLPSGQAIQLMMAAVLHPVRMALCSVAVAAASVLAGIRLFKGKDVK